MPRGDKSKYTDKQKRMAQHIEEGYEERGMPADEAASRAWATVNATDGGGKKSGSGRGKPRNPEPAKRGGRGAPHRRGEPPKSGPHRQKEGQKRAAGMQNTQQKHPADVILLDN